MEPRRYVLGIDPGLRNCAFALLDAAPPYVCVRASTYDIVTKELAKANEMLVVNRVRRAVDHFLEGVVPYRVISERNGAIPGGVQTHINVLMFGLCGIFTEREVGFIFVSPATVKAYFEELECHGKRTLNKQDAVALAKTWGYAPADDHQADAIILARYLINTLSA